jgi:hypothetical protein
MNTTPVSNAPESPPAESVEQRFRRLEAIWEADTLVLSDPVRITEHWAFQDILRMGEAVVPLMLRDLEREPHLWVWALPRITGASPVAPEERGNIRKMSEAWLRWAKEKGYRW